MAEKVVPRSIPKTEPVVPIIDDGGSTIMVLLPSVGMVDCMVRFKRLNPLPGDLGLEKSISRLRQGLPLVPVAFRALRQNAR